MNIQNWFLTTKQAEELKKNGDLPEGAVINDCGMPAVCGVVEPREGFLSMDGKGDSSGALNWVDSYISMDGSHEKDSPLNWMVDLPKSK